VANEVLFNPNKPTPTQKVLLDVGNPAYWTTKAMENIMSSRNLTEGSVAYNNCINEAIQLLILTKAFLNEKAQKPKKTRKHIARADNESV